MTWSYYSRRMLAWFLIGGGFLALIYIIMSIGYAAESLGTMTFGMTFLSLPVMVSPLVFATSGTTRQMEVQLPATWAEKSAVYILFVLVAAPVAMLAVWYLCEGISWLCGANGDLYQEYIDMVKSQVKDGMMVNGKFQLSNITSTAAVILIGLYTVIAAKTHRGLKGILAMFGTLFAVGIFSGLYGFFVALKNFKTGVASEFNETQFIDNLNSLNFTLTIFFGVCTALLIYLVCRKVRQIQL